MPLAAKSRPTIRPSVPEPRSFAGLLYQREALGHIARELPSLFELHHAELAVDPVRAPLDPDWSRYFDYDLAGHLAILTVRDGPLLVGYLFNIIGPHLHKKSTLWAHIDIYWLMPAYRVGWTGVRMFVENEVMLRELGVKKVTSIEKVHFHNDRGRRNALIYKRLGYAVEDIAYAKWIGDK